MNTDTDRAAYERTEQVREDVRNAEVIGAIPTFIARRALAELDDGQNPDDVAAMIEAVAKVWHGPASSVLHAFDERDRDPGRWTSAYRRALDAAKHADPAIYALMILATADVDRATRRTARFGLAPVAPDVLRWATSGITLAWLTVPGDVEDRRMILRALAAVEIVRHAHGVVEPSTAI